MYLDSVHYKLAKQHAWYRAWHKNPNHGIWHWIFFLMTAVFVTNFLVVEINKDPIIVQAAISLSVPVQTNAHHNKLAFVFYTYEGNQDTFSSDIYARVQSFFTNFKNYWEENSYGHELIDVGQNYGPYTLARPAGSAAGCLYYPDAELDSIVAHDVPADTTEIWYFYPCGVNTAVPNEGEFWYRTGYGIRPTTLNGYADQLQGYRFGLPWTGQGIVCTDANGALVPLSLNCHETPRQGDSFSNKTGLVSPAVDKLHIGWLAAANNQIVTTSGVYHIAPLEVLSSGTMMLTIHPSGDASYSVEARQPIGIDTGLSMGSGVYIRQNESMIDMTPTTTGKFDQSFAIGQTLTLPVSGTTITLQSVDSTGANIQVNYGGTTPPPPPPPPTAIFSASPTSISSGGSSTLSWSTTNATSVSINQGIGTVAIIGSRIVSPTVTTTYTLTATNSSGSTTAQATVTVSATPPPPTATLTASPTSITSGSSSTLFWSTSNATSVSINQGIGTVATSGNRSVSPTVTTSYTLTATNSSGSATAQSTVTVTAAPPPPPTATFSASPTSITSGSSSTLTWSTTNATSVSINQGIGTVATSGNRSVSPTVTTIYTLTATNSTGSITAPATVTVTATPHSHITLSPTTLSFSGISGGATPTAQNVTLSNTGSATLNYSASANQTWCHVSPASGSVAVAANMSLSISMSSPTNVGTFSCSVSVADSNADNSPQTVAVTYIVSQPLASHITISPTTLNFSAIANGATPTAQAVTLSNTGNTSMSWALSANQIWCHITPTSGTIASAGSSILSVSVNAPSNTGTSNCQITFTSSNADNTPQVLTVNYIVAVQPLGSISLSSLSLNFSAISGGSIPSSQNILLSNTGTAVLNWTAASNQTWCSMSPLSGSLNVAGQATLAISVGALTNIGTFSCQIVVSSVAANNSPQTITVAYTISSVSNPPPPPPPPTPTPPPAPTTPPPPPPITTSGHPDGTLILSGQTVFLIQNNVRFGFRNSEEYQSYGYNFNQLVTASSSDLSLPFTEQNILKAMAGTLVLDLFDNRTVYMIGLNGTKRGFSSAEVFQGLGYSFNNLRRIELGDYPGGPVIASSTLPHPEGALVLDGTTIWWILNGQKAGFSSQAVFQTYGFDYSRVVLANDADRALPEAPLIKFRDGTLISDADIYYIISDGLKRPFASLSSLATLGFRSSNVISADISSYTLGILVE